MSSVVLGKRHQCAPYLSFATGLLLVAWIAVQTAIVGVRHWSQAIWWLTFTLVAFLSARMVADSRSGHRGG